MTPDKGNSINIERLIAEVAARHGILLKPNDPAFALVTVAQGILEDTAERMGRRFDDRLRTFESAVANAERRAGRLLAEKVRRDKPQLADVTAAANAAISSSAAAHVTVILKFGAAFALGVLLGATTTLLVFP